MAYTHITPGWEIEMSAHYYPDKKADRVAELIQLPREELTTMEEASVAQEKAIFSKFSEIEAEWRKDGTLINCTLSWDIHYNTLQHPTPDYTGDGWKIAGQSDKRFATKEELERYLQGRIKAYAHLFTEVSPPIPKGEERRFSVNGILLPGYTVEASLEERVEEMLSFLEDDPALLEEPLSSGHQDTPQEEPTMAQKLHTTPLNQHRNRESVQKPETARKGPKKPPRRKTAPVR